MAGGNGSHCWIGRVGGNWNLGLGQPLIVGRCHCLEINEKVNENGKIRAVFTTKARWRGGYASFPEFAQVERRREGLVLGWDPNRGQTILPWRLGERLRWIIVKTSVRTTGKLAEICASNHVEQSREPSSEETI